MFSQRAPGGIFDFSASGWGRVILWTTLGTIACVAITLYVDSFNFPNLDPGELTRALIIDTFLPIGLAVPMLLFLTSKLRELAIAHDELERYASIDSLTDVLNRGAFTSLVESQLTEALPNPTAGALLVVDADNFKSINDRFGHDRGDDALRIIARSIEGMLRAGDVVGRIGGEEFGIFLPGASPAQAEYVAERIRKAIADTEFMPDGVLRHLSVSVGGAVYEKRLPFGDLFRVADQQLYAAKNAGRNRVSVAPVVKYDTIPRAAA